VAFDVPTKNELADAIPVSRQMLNRWERDDGAPIKQAQAMPLNEAAEMLRQWRQGSKRPPPPGSNGKRHKQPANLRERLLLAQCERTEQQGLAERLANDERAGLLVNIDDVVREAAQMCATLKAGLECVPDSIATEIPEQFRSAVVERVEHHLWLVLHRLAKTKFETINRTVDDVIIEAADAIKKRRQAEDDQARSGHEVDGDGSDSRGNADVAGGEAEGGISEPRSDEV
jgi:hypothetical protein